MSDADGSFTPGAPRTTPGAERDAHDTPKAPPGLGPQAEVSPGDRGVKNAAAALLWAGGFVLVMAVLAAVWLTNIYAWSADYGNEHDRQDAEEARLIRDWILAVGLVLGAFSIAAGAGVWYRQDWSRAAGIVAGALHLVSLPFGTILGAIAIAGLARSEARRWFG